MCVALLGLATQGGTQEVEPSPDQIYKVIRVAFKLLQTADGDVDSLLDRITLKRSSSMAGQGFDADGHPALAVQLHVLKPLGSRSKYLR